MEDKTKFIKTQMTYYGHHVPSGEDWVILGIDQIRNQICAAGWPATIADLKDITGLTERALRTVQEETHVTKTFGVSFLN